MPKKYAYVWLLMKGNRYAPGLITSAYSIKRLWKDKKNKDIDLVAMVTDDVSKETIVELKKVMDKVKKIKYIDQKSNLRNFTKRQLQLYEKWFSVSYTKWVCLSLYNYKKILFVDSDIIVVKNIDKLFTQVDAPAGVFHNYWSEQFMEGSKIKEYFLKKKEKELKHNTIVNDKSLFLGLVKGGYSINGGLVLLEPSKKYFNNFKRMLKNLHEFGFDSYSGVDEQAIVYFMRFYKNGPKKKWRNINKIYNAIAMKELNKNINYKIRAIHYMGEELPWEKGNWLDLIPYLFIMKESIDKLKLNLNILNFKELNRLNKKYDKKQYDKYMKLFEK